MASAALTNSRSTPASESSSTLAIVFGSAAAFFCFACAELITLQHSNSTTTLANFVFITASLAIEFALRRQLTVSNAGIGIVDQLGFPCPQPVPTHARQAYH